MSDNAIKPGAHKTTSGARGRLDLMLPRGWPETAAPIEWRWQPLQGAVQHGKTDALHSLPEEARTATVRAWTPPADTLLTGTRLPTRSRRKIMQALPYAIEDLLAGDPESLHFAFRREPDGSLSVAVTARERLRTWSEALGKADIRPKSLCPATLLLPSVPDGWTLAFRGDEVLVRTGEVAGFVCPVSTDAPPPLLRTALREATSHGRAPKCLLVFDAPPDFPAEAWQQTLALAVRVERKSLWAAPDGPEAPLDLLQGEFAQESGIGDRLRPFLPALALLLVWLAGNIAVDVADWWTLRRQHQEQLREMTSILLASFPETRTVLDPAAQMRRALESSNARRGDGDLLALLDRTAEALRTDPRIRLRGLRYADQVLTLELAWPADASTDAVRTAFERARLHTEILSAAPQAGGINARVRLTPGAPVTSRKN
ncbi:MAG: type II secretion system protein GspL [Burkholderiales bacterium]